MLTIIIIVVGIALMWLMSSRARQKQQEQQDRITAAMEPGTWVRTSSGFYGIVSDVDGDVVILQNPAGDEMYWDRRAIALVGEPPFASSDTELDADYDLASDTDLAADTDFASDTDLGADTDLDRPVIDGAEGDPTAGSIDETTDPTTPDSFPADARNTDAVSPDKDEPDTTRER